MTYRLQKYLAHCGVASRRASEELIFSGKVMINGTIIYDPSTKIDEKNDKIKCNGKLIIFQNNPIYIMLNKPLKVVSTMRDERGRHCLADIVKVQHRIYPIGRLDYMTTGLLLLTNDGDIYNKTIHPRKHVAKNYIVEITSNLILDEINKLEGGISYKGIQYGKSKIENIDNNIYKITIWEGKNRQIRNMLKSINKNIVSLKRISIGEINIGCLEVGKWRYLNNHEISYLKGL